ncbi:MAG: hypothetical protein ABSE84_02005, partial [Isosphaeraceae bacterium]
YHSGGRKKPRAVFSSQGTSLPSIRRRIDDQTIICGWPGTVGQESTWSIPSKLSRKIRELTHQEEIR